MFFYKKNFYKKMSLQNLKKMLRKFPASNAWAAVFNLYFFLELFNSYKIE